MMVVRVTIIADGVYGTVVCGRQRKKIVHLFTIQCAAAHAHYIMAWRLKLPIQHAGTQPRRQAHPVSTQP